MSSIARAVHNRRFHRFRGLMAAGGVAFMSVISGCDLPPWCKAELCEFQRLAKQAIQIKLEAMCKLPADRQADELRKISDWMVELTAKFGEAVTACRNDQRNLFNDLLKKMWELLEKQKLIRLANGSIVNELPVMGTQGTVQMLAYAEFFGELGGDKRVSMVEYAGKKYLTAALGKVVERSLVSSQQLVSARVISSGDAEAPLVTKYCFNNPVPFTVVWCGTSYTMELTGQIEFTNLAQTGSDQRTGVPVDIQIDVARSDFRAHMMLDTTFPDNQIVVNASGSGKLMAAVNISGSADGFDLAFEKSPVSTAWIEIPIQLSADGRVLAVGSSSPIGALSLFPVSSSALQVMLNTGNDSGASLPPVDAPMCGDHDNDGILNIVERMLHPINCHMKELGCPGYENVTNCP